MKYRSRLIFMVTLATVYVLALTALADVRSPVDLTSKDSSTRETSLGDLVADAVAWAAGVQLAIVPAGSFKEVTIPAGQFEIQRVLECLQYPDDKIVVTELTGLHLRNAFERSVSVYPQKSLGFLQVSGVEFEFDPKSPRGSRVKSVRVSAKPLDNNAKYLVATTKPLADGQYGYFTVWGKAHKISEKDKTISEAVSVFLAGRESVDYRKAGRIRLSNESARPARSGRE